MSIEFRKMIEISEKEYNLTTAYTADLIDDEGELTELGEAWVDFQRYLLSGGLIH